MAARLTGDAKGLARFSFAAPADLDIVSGQPHFLDRVAVGAADLLACDAEPIEERDHCYVAHQVERRARREE